MFFLIDYPQLVKLTTQKTTEEFPITEKDYTPIVEQTQENIIEKYDKGWNIDDTLRMEVDIITMFDILRPVLLANEHEKRVVSLIERIYPYITQPDKNQKTKVVSQSLKDELVEIKLEYVRHIYRQAISIAVEDYNKVVSV